MSSYTIQKKRHEKPCELCSKAGVQSTRLDPVNWHPETRRLCTHHRNLLGYRPVDYGHTTGRMSDR